MKPRSREKQKGRRSREPFTLLPHAVQDCPNFAQLSPTATKLLLAAIRQYNGHNNGDLCLTAEVCGACGISSPEAMVHARRELEHFGFLMLTKRGGLGIGPNLYAITWRPIDHCGGKLDCSPTAVAPGTWKTPQERYRRTAKNTNATSNTEAGRFGIRSERRLKAV